MVQNFKQVYAVSRCSPLFGGGQEQTTDKMVLNTIQ